jgi:ubiquitin-conjugating enzyme E2 Q
MSSPPNRKSDSDPSISMKRVPTDQSQDQQSNVTSSATVVAPAVVAPLVVAPSVVAPTQSRSNLLISEMEDNDVATTSRSIDEQGINGVLVQDEGENNQDESTNNASYAERQGEVSDGVEDADGSGAENDDDESDYSYDSDDDGHYSGFICAPASQGPTQNDTSNNVSAAVVPRDDIVEDGNTEMKEACSNYRQVSNASETGVIGGGVSSSDQTDEVQFASLEQINAVSTSKSSWKEPSKAAISMSLRAEKETTGGRRRLASDLYKIMMNDTNEAGFDVEAADEESMDTWKIRLFKFDSDSKLYKDMLILGLDHVELEMSFPDQYPFEPPFVRVVRPRFKKSTGFVMNGALCMELLTSDGWNPVNDIESVIVSIRSLLVVGDGQLEAAANMSEEKRNKLLAAAISREADEDKGLKREEDDACDKDEENDDTKERATKRKRGDIDKSEGQAIKGYSTNEAKVAYAHLSSYHKKKGWSGWWAQRG